jgi:ActR/RegA family two-component response regulator
VWVRPLESANPRLFPKRSKHMPAQRIEILFVDDEESIRVLLPAVLEKHGFKVRTAASVAEALVEINASRFDVLICDLNLEKPGDGFLVLSAMRHLHPDCVNLILTGYPAFETALQAIHNQVDDYLVKPADIETLIATIEKKLHFRRSTAPALPRRLASVLEGQNTLLAQQAIDALERHPELSGARLPRADRLKHLTGVIAAVHEQLEKERDQPSDEHLRLAAEYGKSARTNNYKASMLVAEFRVIEEMIGELIRNNLMHMATTGLFYDMDRLNKGLGALMLAALQAYENAGPKQLKKIRRETVGLE